MAAYNKTIHLTLLVKGSKVNQWFLIKLLLKRFDWAWFNGIRLQGISSIDYSATKEIQAKISKRGVDWILKFSFVSPSYAWGAYLKKLLISVSSFPWSKFHVNFIFRSHFEHAGDSDAPASADRPLQELWKTCARRWGSCPRSSWIESGANGSGLLCGSVSILTCFYFIMSERFIYLLMVHLS